MRVGGWKGNSGQCLAYTYFFFQVFNQKLFNVIKIPNQSTLSYRESIISRFYFIMWKCFKRRLMLEREREEHGGERRGGDRLREKHRDSRLWPGHKLYPMPRGF